MRGFENIIGTFHGIKVIESVYATEEKWNFKRSKYRSRRLHKKLLKRFGVQMERVPAMFLMANNGRETYVAHPAIVEQIRSCGPQTQGPSHE